MRLLFTFVFSVAALYCTAQHPADHDFAKDKDSMIIVGKKPGKGFYSSYILFIPKNTPTHDAVFLLVEPNNTGKLSDSIYVHTQAAIQLASVSSVGNNIATELHIPLLVPVFPRPASQELLYTHALDRDVMRANDPLYKRLDLQLIAMIKDARQVLSRMHIEINDKIFMSGFSASATFTNRFSFLHPGMIQALAMGGFNGELILPQTEINNHKLNYPLGINDFKELFQQSFDSTTYRTIPQYIYMGKLDDNDAVQYDDAYSEEERNIINTQLAATVQERYTQCQAIYQHHHIYPVFKSYENVGHWTNATVNLDVIKFFLQQAKTK